MTPRTSVIIPCFERPTELERAISSVLRQTDQSFEVIVGDDGSTADLAAVVAGFNDTRLHLARREVSGGASAGRNAALPHAQGRFIAYLDSDDEWLPEHLSTVVDAIERAPSAVAAVTSGFEMRYPDGRVDTRVPKQHRRLLDRIVRGVDLSAGSTMIVRREAQSDVGRWPEELRRNEEYDWFLRMAKRGHELRITDRVTVVIHADDRSPIDIESLRRAHAILLERHLPDLTPPQRRHLRAKLHEERAWAAWRGDDRRGLLSETAAALALDPAGRGTKLGRSAIKRLQSNVSPPARSRPPTVPRSSP
jgi:glycosyltransferase involved in cell wall biosynthesis